MHVSPTKVPMVTNQKGAGTIDVVSKLQRQLKELKKEMEEELTKKNAKIKSLEKVQITKALCDSFQVLEKERMQLKEENGTYRISLADAKQKIEGLVRSQASYPPEVDQILNEMKADLDKKDARIIGLTKDLCAANSKLEEVKERTEASAKRLADEEAGSVEPSLAYMEQLQRQVQEHKSEIDKRDGRIIRLTVGLCEALDKVEEEKAMLKGENEVYRKQLVRLQRGNA